MTQASSQASKFYEEVAASQNIFTLVDNGSFLVFRTRDTEVVPFWSSASRIAIVQKNHLKYRALTCDKIDLPVFLERTMPDSEREGVHIGVNWSGARMTGYDVSVADLLKNLAYWQSKLANR